MKKALMGIGFLVIAYSCSTQQKVVRVEPQVQEIKQEEQEQVLKRKVAIARFSNETQYAKGIFYDKDNDPLGKQAVDILSTKLASTNKFILLERQDMDKILEELKIAGTEAPQKVGADYLIIGSVTEFGRKNVGDVNVFSRSKTQTVQAGVNIRLVDVSTGQIIYSEEAKGEAETTNKTVMGFGERADYDATLADKAISAAISKLVENIVNNCMDRPWKSYFLVYDTDGILISGGKSQGLRVGDIYEVVQKGKTVTNPQTGMSMELPGKTVGKVEVNSLGGETSDNEFAIVSFIEGSIDQANLTNYYIKQIQ
ncbi:MAG TPA: penicillin-binding protein activator LpoB [Porphyromonadaceae bacterium]|jgi:curli biogenesis system outer membrane secretion channel CsgG|uniref:CsgG/HfaB family protein n=1 Tax=Limibacterium fermenti TaxID=3229863 RepID=UPI000E9744CD|nr:penicillin-binding protein activator LpoB [Porphyromonadaceae bacterium]HBL34727.1 penicillin-binding protein activator LpoB [Porphyromonadaceae bacterium]HBX46483.1 penicillin-binding protein activator LpoB [Porphyromonadaceae bacterium]HCM19672.1 penicillin-binding protein activator LpoB [Porphyromonadaceae bacterium]